LLRILPFLLLLPTVATAASGGPDAWGYTWADTNDAGGPGGIYYYAPGSPLGLGDDDSTVVNLGFSFEFYGITYTSVRVHSNGAITFGAGGSSLSFVNQCPLSGFGADIAAPFWDDLDPSASASIGVYAGSGTDANGDLVFIAEWFYMQNWVGTGDVTLEVQLHDDDDHIEFVYLDTDLGSSTYTDGASASVGIFGGALLSPSCNASSLLTGGYAIGFFPPPPVTDVDGDGWDDTVDCNDFNAAINPGATESCDFVDNDCDGSVDEGFDSDGDGWPPCAGDWNDLYASTYPGAAESCDGIDNDCDSSVDEGFDSDGDGWTTCGGDCNDLVASINPGAAESCDGIDNDCDGTADEDFDGDGDGYLACDGDCDDSDAGVSPGAIEVCDFVDNDCDGTIDEGFDADGDSWLTCDGDCDDSDSAIYPGAPEICDGADSDCDGVNADLTDGDGDGWLACDDPADCDDADPTIHPGATDIPGDGIDQDCDGEDQPLPGDDDDASDDDDDDAADDDDDQPEGDDDDASSDDDDDDPDDDDTSWEDDGIYGDNDSNAREARSVTFGCSCNAATSRPSPLLGGISLLLLGLFRRRGTRFGRGARQGRIPGWD
jgi:hypothetical protein